MCGIHCQQRSSSQVVTDLVEHRLKKKNEKEGEKKKRNQQKSFQVVAVHMGWNQAGLLVSHFYK